MYYIAYKNPRTQEKELTKFNLYQGFNDRNEFIQKSFLSVSTFTIPGAKSFQAIGFISAEYAAKEIERVKKLLESDLAKLINNGGMTEGTEWFVIHSDELERILLAIK